MTIIERIESVIGSAIVDCQAVGGGCIAQTQVVKAINESQYFLKTGFEGDLFIKEANGLNELRKANAIRVPEVIAVDKDFLLLEKIDGSHKSNDFFRQFGTQYARMHMLQGDGFGFFEDNYIGSTPQLNRANDDAKRDWTTFYFNKRLLYQFKLAERNGYSDSVFAKNFAGIENGIENILKWSEEPPVLLHGDLWGGNYMVDEAGQAVLIDPAVYYGHREADLAMTKLFGGFSFEFYQAYQKQNPLKEGFEYRENIYLLYHVLNHLNLFGSSYKGQALQLMQSYL